MAEPLATARHRAHHGGPAVPDDLLATARAYVAAGWSVIPVRADGTKAPAGKLLPLEPDPHTGEERPSWKEFQRRRPDDAELSRWFAAGAAVGVALVAGAVSGGAECIDIDAPELCAPWLELVASEAPDLPRRLCVVETPGGGWHVWYRCPKPSGNRKLAERAKGEPGKPTLIETRGEGGYALAPGCGPGCHVERKPYRHLDGPPLTAVGTVTDEERGIMLSAAASFNRRGESEPVPGPPSSVGTRPGDEFDRAGWPWADILGPHGWVEVRPGLWRRPGKAQGWSATTGNVKGAHGEPLLHVFSSSAEPFRPGHNYGRFRAFALLNHRGDLAAAAADLRRKGFGGGGGRAPAPTAKGPPAAANGPPPDEPLFAEPIPASQLKRAEGGDWLVRGYYARRSVTLLSALWKAGKTTFLMHMLRALENGGSFCGLEVTPARVLYVTEESESRWAERRDAVGIHDHVYFQVRPFKVKARMDGWLAFIDHAAKLARRERYDLVLLDTLANLWPVRDENDASAVQEALMPLHQVADVAAVGLAHHVRKSDGQEATASRGSGALPAFVDTIIELRRFTPNDRTDRKRILTGYGRYDETPDEVVIELADTGFHVLGDAPQARAKTLVQSILNVLPGTEPGLTWEEIREAMPEGCRPATKRLLDVLKWGLSEGLWLRRGSGVKGSPHTYWLSPSAPAQQSFSFPPLRGRNENTSEQGATGGEELPP